MSRDRYFELYKKFLNHTITQDEYEELMEWVADEKNDFLLRSYMEKIWDQSGSDQEGMSLSEFKHQLENTSVVGRLNIRRRRTLIRIGYAAASVLVLMVMSYVGYLYFNNAEEIFQTAYGETLEVELEDGSQVTLNANTTLVWNRYWKKNGTRKIRLEGEAFFDVTHTQDDLPFVVETEDLTVNVLGTTFRVRVRENKTDVVLESGKVMLDLNRSWDRVLEMLPGDRIHYSAIADELKKEQVEEDDGLDWMEGVLRFEDVSVADMFSKIEELYGKKLVAENEDLLSRRMFTGIPFEDWPVAKQAIELALGVELFEDEETIKIIEK